MNDNFTKIRDYIINKIKSSKFLDDWFYADHLLEVEKQAIWLCDQHPEANSEAVLLSVWLHDIGRIEKGMDDGHEGYAYTRALELLPKYKYSPQVTQLVAESCQTHRADGVIPKSLEGKILTSADALSHFYHNVYFRVFEHYRKSNSFTETITIVKKKIDRDYESKLFFPQAQHKVEKLYKSWTEIFNNSL